MSIRYVKYIHEERNGNYKNQNNYSDGYLNIV
jgi:hypothetical protein